MYNRLYWLGNRCAKLQTKNLSKAEKYDKKIDKEVERLKSKGGRFKLLCNKMDFELPVKLEELPYFRPLFKMATHRKLPEVRADDRHAVDFDVPYGTNVYAAACGVITSIKSTGTLGGNDRGYSGMDNYLYIYNSAKNLVFCYRHLAPFDHLKNGDYVTPGMFLGKTGKTGYVITPHLHFVIYHYAHISRRYNLQSRRIRFE